MSSFRVWCQQCRGIGLLGESHVTPEMAQDAGAPEMAGMPMDHVCDACGGNGYVEGMDPDDVTTWNSKYVDEL